MDSRFLTILTFLKVKRAPEPWVRFSKLCILGSFVILYQDIQGTLKKQGDFGRGNGSKLASNLIKVDINCQLEREHDLCGSEGRSWDPKPSNKKHQTFKLAVMQYLIQMEP